MIRYTAFFIAVIISGMGAWAEEAATSANGVKVYRGGAYDIDAGNTDIRFVLEALARRSGTNIIISPDVTGNITARLSKLPVEDILTNLGTVHGFDWKKEGDTYIITARPKAEVVAAPAQPDRETCVWQCRYILPGDAAQSLAKLFPEMGVAEGPASASPELSSADTGIGTLSGGEAGSSSDQSTSKKNNRTIIIMGKPTDVAQAKMILEQIDIPREQIAIDVTVAEVNRTSDNQAGFAWSWSSFVLKEQSNTSGIWFGKINKQPGSFTAEISALFKNGFANLLAQPNISVVDGESADILIGNRILFPKLVGYTEFGNPIFDKQEERVGIYLQIAPRVTGEDQIMLRLYPQVSLVTGYLKTQGGDYPQINTREARTTVSVKSGVTLAIGGLLKDDEIVNSSKVPILGDLPILGQFFKHNKKTTERTELVMFLTPRIIRESDAVVSLPEGSASEIITATKTEK